MPISPMDMLKYVISEQTRARSHMTPEQKGMMTGLRSILDPKDQTFNPVSRLGAQVMQEEGKQIGHWQSPLNVLGLTFHNDYLPEELNPVETRMLREAGLSPISARGQIAVGPEAMTGKRPDVIPHEMAHKAIQSSGIETFGLEEQVIRQLMINDGINVKENMEFLNATTRMDEKNVRTIIQEIAKAVADQADLKLKKKGK